MRAFDRKPTTGRPRLLAGWLVLLLYVAAFSPLAMGGVVLLGLFDPGHEVVLQSGMDRTRVVLHHRGNCIRHQHSPVASTLTIFARPVSAADPDHVLQFGATATLLKAPEQLVRLIPVCEKIFTAGPDIASPFTLAMCRLTLSIHSPPDCFVRLFQIRSTVLLI